MNAVLKLGILAALAWTAACTTTPALPTLAVLPSVTPTVPPTATATFTPSLTPTVTPTFTRTATPTPTPTFTPTVTPTPTSVFAYLGYAISTLPEGAHVRTITSDFERYYFTFTGSAGEVITLTMQNIQPELDPMLVLVDPSGTPIAIDDDANGSRNAILAAITLPVNGEYAVQVLSGGAVGMYQLIFERNAPQVVITPVPPTETPTPSLTPTGTVTPAPTFTPAPSATPFDGRVQIMVMKQTLTADQTVDLPFYGRAGWTVEIRTEGEPDVDPIAALIAPDGSLIAENDDSGGTRDSAIEAPLTQSGTHQVRVRAYGAGGTVRVTVIARAVG